MLIQNISCYKLLVMVSFFNTVIQIIAQQTYACRLAADMVTSVIMPYTDGKGTQIIFV